MFTDGIRSYIGKGAEKRMYASIKARIGDLAKVTQKLHMDYGDNKIGFMVEAALMRRNRAVELEEFVNEINSPGEKLLVAAEKKDPALYQDIIKKAEDFENKFNNLNSKKTIKCR